MFETVFHSVSPFDIKVVGQEVLKLWPILKLVTIIYLFLKKSNMLVNVMYCDLIKTNIPQGLHI